MEIAAVANAFKYKPVSEKKRHTSVHSFLAIFEFVFSEEGSNRKKKEKTMYKVLRDYCREVFSELPVAILRKVGNIVSRDPLHHNEAIPVNLLL